jgi:signal transduction histidine kinase
MPQDLLNRSQKTGGEAGIGLLGMSERVNELGAQLEVASGTNGTVVSVTVPLNGKPR